MDLCFHTDLLFFTLYPLTPSRTNFVALSAIMSQAAHTACVYFSHLQGAFPTGTESNHATLNCISITSSPAAEMDYLSTGGHGSPGLPPSRFQLITEITEEKKRVYPLFYNRSWQEQMCLQLNTHPQVFSLVLMEMQFPSALGCCAKSNGIRPDQ